MANKSDTGKVLLWCGVIVAVGVGGYFLYTKVIAPPAATNNTVSKEDEVVAILSNSGGQGCYNTLMSLDNSYIASWYNAVKAKQPYFTSGSGKFCTVTGKGI